MVTVGPMRRLTSARPLLVLVAALAILVTGPAKRRHADPGSVV